MKRFIKKHAKEIIITASAVLFVILVCCAIVMANDYSSGLDRQAEDNAKVYSSQIGSLLNSKTDEFISYARNVAADLPDTKDATCDYLMSCGTENTVFFRFVCDGVEYDIQGFEFDGVESPYMTSAFGHGKTVVSGFINDEETGAGGYAVYAPAPNRAFADGIIVFFSSSALEGGIEYVPKGKVSPVYSGICSYGGVIARTLYKRNFELDKYDNLFDKMRAYTNNKQAVDKMMANVSTGDPISISIAGMKYVVCFNGVSVSPENLYTVNIYRANEIYYDGYRLIDSIFAIIIVLSIITAGIIIYTIFHNFKTISVIDDFEMIDPVLRCPTQKKFLISMEDILKKNKITLFAVAVAEISHFEYISDDFGEKESEEALVLFSKLLAKSLTGDEAYCRIQQSKFALFLHFRDTSDLLNRLKVVTALARKGLSRDGRYLNIKTGVYFVDRSKNYTVQRMLESASIAQRTNDAQNESINVYDEKVHEKYLREAEIETIMESSLEAGEFKVFYQPKYNIAHNRADGSEALVRWFNPKENRFRPPSEFISLFEANGFVSKLDRYVFVEVCKYFRESIERGYKLVPVSVNISRVTAIREDFLDFYINNKKKYGVADGFLTLEFTESFAFENYDMLFVLVNKLHANGINCSIDDFGSGYSSFEILKRLPMDELKLDRFFIQKGVSDKRDEILLSSIINLAKNLGMKVTQEGVEDAAIVAKLREFGCDVIQGYFYSKPLPVDDYISFISDKFKI